MSTVLNTLRKTELISLRDLIGAEFDSIAQEGLPDYLAGTEVLIVTDRNILHIWSEVEELSFEGFEEDYSSLRVNSGGENLATATELGDRYYFHSGEHIERVAVVRETVSESKFGNPTWEYTSDIAIILTLSGGTLVIERDDLNMEVFHIRFFDKDESPVITSPTTYWQDTLDTRYRVERLVVPVETLLLETD